MELPVRKLDCSPDAAVKLCPRVIAKPWGRTQLPQIFGDVSGGSRIGEIWFEHPESRDLPLLVKVIFAAQNLSVQVHPDAGTTDHGPGKSESWYVLNATPGARIAHGLRTAVTREELRAAASDGSLELMLDWKIARPGDFFFVPSGMIHAIGGGVDVVEFAQCGSETYRLFDYGRDRPIDLDKALDVANRQPEHGTMMKAGPDGEAVLLSTADFSVIRVISAGAMAHRVEDRQRWVVPLRGTAGACGETVRAGECLLVEPGPQLEMGPGSLVLIGLVGPV